MAQVIFYEKPGCKGNLRQKTLLAAAGHQVEARSLKSETWTDASLLAFLAPLPVDQWFNRAAPAVKSGEIVPENLSVEAALPLLRANPLLIRRPLLQVGDERRVGFDPEAIAAWIGLAGVALPEGNLEACVHGPEGHGRCGSAEADGEDHGHGRCGTH
jgi:nitrogenase-associated protein